MPYKHLTKDDRGDIEALLRSGCSQSAAARQIGVHRSTISREIHRNGNVLTGQTIKLKLPNKPKILSEDCRHARGTGKAGEKQQALIAYQKRLSKRRREVSQQYSRREAQHKASRQRQYANSLRAILPKDSSSNSCNSLLEGYILHKLTVERWSPEQIAGRLDVVYGVRISKDTIYAYIYRDENQRKLAKYLRHHGNKYRKRAGSLKRIAKNKASLPSIHERPAAANIRSRIGDLEGDTIVGLDSKDRLLTHNDRATGECRIRLVLAYNADKIAEQTLRSINSFGGNMRSITYDRGSEFSRSDKVARVLYDGIYFADAYASWQRGSNENLNGLIRDFVPRRSDFKLLTEQDVTSIEQKLNNRPRKRYNWATPLEQRAVVGWSN